MLPLCSCFLLIFTITSCRGQSSEAFEIPEVKIEAFKPAGFRAYIPALPGIELFAFHGKVNQKISQIEPGDFTKDVTQARNGFFTYFNPTLKLKIGDVIHYWVFVQQKQLGYRKDDMQFKVTELFDEGKKQEGGTSTGNKGGQGTGDSDGSQCDTSISIVTGKPSVCKNTFIVEDHFNGTTLDKSIWVMEHYVPTHPNFQFVIYKQERDVTFVANGMLCIKPKVIEDPAELRKDIDLSEGCTRPKSEFTECKVRFFNIPQNPIISGKISTKVSFMYGEIEIRAKLPKGDWIYPEIYLEDVNNPLNKLWIAYSRGNDDLKGSDGSDIGGSLLYGGPVVDPYEPDRSKYLKSYRNSEPLTNQMHIYSLKWTPNQVELRIDGNKYGNIDSDILNKVAFLNREKLQLVIGVAVGGIADFPDGYKSGPKDKPWINREKNQVRKFYSRKDDWYQTWGDQSRQLKVDYIKISAI